MFPLEQMLDVQFLIKDKKQYDTVNLFGIIAYTEQNPFVIKVLRDDDFWRSLNARTKGWILYAIKPNSRYYGGGNARYINDSLGLKPEDYPSLILLSIGPNRTMIQRNYPIKGDSTDSMYQFIENIVKIITDSVDRIRPQYRSSTNVHREATGALDAELATKHWKRVSSAFFELIRGFIL